MFYCRNEISSMHYFGFVCVLFNNTNKCDKTVIVHSGAKKKKKPERRSVVR